MDHSKLSTDHSVELLKRFQGGDDEAAGELFDRYVNRLIALAGSRLSETLRRRVEPEDIVQSACRSFFRNAVASRYELQNSSQLWGLLAAITINKVRDKARHHGAQKRALSQEQSINTSRSCYGLVPADLTHEPTVDEAVELQEQLRLTLNELSDLQREILELYLQNCDAPTIANQIRRSPRTVRRALEEIRNELESRLGN